MTHPFQHEIKSTPTTARVNHEVQWIAPVQVDKPRIQILTEDGGGMEACVEVAGIPLPGSPVLWVDGSATATPGAPTIGVGQLVYVVGQRPFTVLVSGLVPNLPGTLPEGIWLAYPNRVCTSVEFGYWRVRRVHGLMEGDTVVLAPNGQEIAVDPRGFLVTPVLIGPGEVLRRTSTSRMPLMMIGDSIIPILSAVIVGDYVADAIGFQVDAEGNEVTLQGPAVLAAIREARTAAATPAPT